MRRIETPKTLRGSSNSSDQDDTIRYALFTHLESTLDLALADEFARDRHGILILRPEVSCNGILLERLRTRGAQDVRFINVSSTDVYAPEGIDDFLDRHNVNLACLINNFSLGHVRSSVELSAEVGIEILQKSIEVHTSITSALIPRLESVENAGILNVCSVNMHDSNSFLSLYHAARAYVVSFSEEVCELVVGSDISVSCLLPEAGGMRKGSLVGDSESTLENSFASKGYAAFKNGERICFGGYPNRVITFIRRIGGRSSSPNYRQPRRYPREYGFVKADSDTRQLYARGRVG